MSKASDCFLDSRYASRKPNYDQITKIVVIFQRVYHRGKSALSLTCPRLLAIIHKVSGEVPKWLKGPHSKCGRPLIAAQEFKSLLLRQKTRGFPQFLREAAFFLCVQKRLVFRFI